MSAGIHDLGGTFHEIVVYLVTDDSNSSLILLCPLTGMWGTFSRDLGSDEDFFLILGFSNKTIVTI